LVQPIIIDNTDSEASASGNWGTSSSLPHYGSDYLWIHIPSNQGSIRYTPTITTAGEYGVYVRFPTHSSRSTSVRHEITHANGVTAVFINQQTCCNDFHLLGNFNFNVGTSGFLTITTTGSGSGVVNVDAAQFLSTAVDPSTSTSPSPSPSIPSESEIIVDNSDTCCVTTTGTWGEGSGLPHYGPDYLWSSGPGHTATYTPVLPQAGTYEVFELHPSHANRGTVSVRIQTSSSTSTVSVNQAINGNTFNSLGSYAFGATGSENVRISTDGMSGSQFGGADAFKFVLSTGGPVSVTTSPSPSPSAIVTSDIVIDAESTSGDVSLSGGWACGFSLTPLHQSCYHWVQSSSAVATFTPTISSAGNFEVFFWWASHENRSPSVTFRVLANGSTTNINVDQRSGGRQFVSMGTFFFAAGTSNVISVFSGSGGFSSVDAIKLTPA
jgi:hypothetical protein